MRRSVIAVVTAPLVVMMVAVLIVMMMGMTAVATVAPAHAGARATRMTTPAK
jgi:hypothetical protein